MKIKDIFFNITEKFNIPTKIENKKSNNIVNSPNSKMQGNNYGVEYIGGDKITQFNNVTLIVSKENESKNIKIIDLENDINRIKKIKDYSYSLIAIEEYKKLLLINYPNRISDEDYIKILLNICYIHINRNELNEVNEFIEKLEEISVEGNKDIIKIKGLIAFNTQNYKLALDIMNKVKWDIDEQFEWVLYQSLRCINKLNTYKEFLEKINLENGINLDYAQSIYHIIAITAKNENEYEDMILYSHKAFDNIDDIHSKLKLAYSLYDYAIKDSIVEDIVIQDRINYQYLIESKLACEKSLSLAKKFKNIKLYEETLLLYINILALLGKGKEALENLENIKFMGNNEEFIKFEDRLKFLYSKQENNIATLNEEEIYLKTIFDLLDCNKYSEVISKIESDCLNKYKNSIRIHCILLECYIETKEYKKFIRHIRNFDIDAQDSNLLIKIKARYHMQQEEYEEAEKYLNNSIDKYRDPDSYCLLLQLYDKQNEKEKFEYLAQRILKEDKFVLEVEYIRFYKYYFNFLFKYNFYDKALSILKNCCDKDKFGEINYMNININILSNLGRHFDSAQELEKLFKTNNDYKIIFNAANEYFRCNELERSMEILNNLEDKNVSFLEKIYVMKSNIYILKNDLEKSYEYAEKAKEMVKDFPKSEIHNFFVSRSLRCNKIDSGVIHINEFLESYPKVDDWVKSIKSIDVDSDGNEILSPEITEFLEIQSNEFNNLLNIIRQGQIGISLICKQKNYGINDLIKWKDIYNIKININAGYNEKMNTEIKNISDIIIIDAFILYILADIDELELLKNFKKVNICNSTIEYLNYLLLKKEDENIRKILLYIECEINIQIIYINNHIKNNFETIFRDSCDDFILDSILYAKESGYSYCYGEVYIKQICDTIGGKSFSLVSLISYLNKEDSFKVINKLMNKNYTFINFTYKDMYYIAKDSNFSNENRDIDKFFEIRKNCDIVSFINQYIIFIYSIYYLHRDSIGTYLEMYLKSMNSLYKKSHYYIFMNMESANRLYANRSLLDKFSYLSNNREYIRGITMQIGAIFGVKALYNLFENEKEVKYYLNLVNKILDTNLINYIFKKEYFEDKNNYHNDIKQMIMRL